MLGDLSPLSLVSLQVVYFLVHNVKGTPFISGDQGATRRLTNWEQMDNGEQFTSSRKFIIAVTVILYVGLFLCCLMRCGGGGDSTSTSVWG